MTESEPEPEIVLDTDVASLVPMNLDVEPDGYSELEDEGDEDVEYEDADTSGDPVDAPDEES